MGTKGCVLLRVLTKRQCPVMSLNLEILQFIKKGSEVLEFVLLFILVF